MQLGERIGRSAIVGALVLIVIIVSLGGSYFIARAFTGVGASEEPDPVAVADACEIFSRQTFWATQQLPAVVAAEDELVYLTKRDASLIVMNEDVYEITSAKWSKAVENRSALVSLVEASLTPTLQWDNLLFGFLEHELMVVYVTSTDIEEAHLAEDAAIIEEAAMMSDSYAGGQEERYQEAVDASIAECGK